MKKNNNRKSEPGQLLFFASGQEEKKAAPAPALATAAPAGPPEGGALSLPPPLAGAPRVVLAQGRDELNLAEFPLATLGDSAAAGGTLEFSDTIYDQGAARHVARTLTVTASAAHGLPAAADSDVLLALIQLTRWHNGFTVPTVPFSRYALLQLLGWTHGGASYARAEQSLDRWVGTTLYFDRAWWDRRQKTWVSEKFHILDRVSLRERGDALSTFTWGAVVFASFQAENLKPLDLAMYFGLKLPTSRRLYRFLDKRFHNRPLVSFDLRALACEHVGLSRGYHNGEIRRKLAPAVRELEDRGFLEPLPDDVRYSSRQRGSWRVAFLRKAQGGQGAAEEGDAGRQGLAAELERRGVSGPAAAGLAAGYPADHVRARIEVLDWLLENQDPRAAQSPAGYLVASIRDGYKPPAGFRPPAERQEEAQAQAAKAEAAKARTEQAAAARAAGDAEAAARAAERQAPVDAYLAALPAAERQALAVDAALAAGGQLAATARQGGAAGLEGLPPLRAAMLRSAVAAHVRGLLGLEP